MSHIFVPNLVLIVWKVFAFIEDTWTHLLFIFIECIYKLNWPTIVEGDPKAPFSIATTQRCRGRCYSFLWIVLLTLDPYLIMLSVKQGSIKYHVLSLGMTRPGVESWPSGPLANTLTIMPMNIYIYIYITLSLCIEIIFTMVIILDISILWKVIQRNFIEHCHNLSYRRKFLIVFIKKCKWTKFNMKQNVWTISILVCWHSCKFVIKWTTFVLLKFLYVCPRK